MIRLVSQMSSKFQKNTGSIFKVYTENGGSLCYYLEDRKINLHRNGNLSRTSSLCEFWIKQLEDWANQRKQFWSNHSKIIVCVFYVSSLVFFSADSGLRLQFSWSSDTCSVMRKVPVLRYPKIHYSLRQILTQSKPHTPLLEDTLEYYSLVSLEYMTQHFIFHK
jgi:hypothetical protein